MPVLVDDINSLKDEVNRFIALVNNELIDKKKLKNITKNLLFQKEVLVNETFGNSYYNKVYIYNCLLMIETLKHNSILFFYQVYRTSIENFIRSVLDFDDNDETGVNAMFDLLYSKIETSDELVGVYNFIKGEYGKACDYVHSNIKSNISIYLYYDQIINSDEINNEVTDSLVDKIMTLEKMTSKMILIMFNLHIETLYYRRYEVLEFLVGKKAFLTYKEKLPKL